MHLNVTRLTTDYSQPALSFPEAQEKPAKIKIDVSVIFAPLEVTAFLDVTKVDVFSRMSYLELIEEKSKEKEPYILALVQDAGSVNLHECDALGLEQWQEKSSLKPSLNPMTNQKISNIFFFTLIQYTNTEKDCFDYLGNSNQTGNKKIFLNRFLGAHQGKKEDQCDLGHSYFTAQGTPKDLKKAFYWFERSSLQGYAIAVRNLGLCYENGHGVEKDLKKAFCCYESSAKQGVLIAQYNLGLCYEQAIGVEKDLGQAAYWYEQAANQGNIEAQYKLGLCYINGDGVLKDLKKAFYWFKCAANKGLDKAQYALADCYKEGSGVKQDLKQAFYWCEKAALQDHTNAQCHLGYCYKRALGVDEDLKKAFYWCERSAKLGNFLGQFNLGLFYMRGIGTCQSFKKALFWFNASADQGEKTVNFNMAICHASSKNPNKDWNQAIRQILLCQNVSISQEVLLEIYDFFQIDEKEMPLAFKEAINTLTA